MNLFLKRDVFGDHFTLGKMSVDGGPEFFTCEDKVRDIKVYGVTAIPTGIYKIILTMSNRFQRTLPLIVNVPGFSCVRIHSGNTDADTDGCILIGMKRTAEGVAESRLAMDFLMNLLHDAVDKNEGITIEVA